MRIVDPILTVMLCQTILKTSIILIIIENWQSDYGMFVDFLPITEARPINTPREKRYDAEGMLFPEGKDDGNIIHIDSMANDIPVKHKNNNVTSESMIYDRGLKVEAFENDRQNELFLNRPTEVRDKIVIKALIRKHYVKLVASSDRPPLESPSYRSGHMLSSNCSAKFFGIKAIKALRHHRAKTHHLVDSKKSNNTISTITITRRNGTTKTTRIWSSQFKNGTIKPRRNWSFMKRRKSRLHNRNSFTILLNILKRSVEKLSRYVTEPNQDKDINIIPNFENPQSTTARPISDTDKSNKTSHSLRNLRKLFGSSITEITKFQPMWKGERHKKLFSNWKPTMKENSMDDIQKRTTPKFNHGGLFHETINRSKKNIFWNQYAQTKDYSSLDDVSSNRNAISNRLFQRKVVVKNKLKGRIEKEIKSNSKVSIPFLNKKCELKYSPKNVKKRLKISWGNFTQRHRVTRNSRFKNLTVDGETEDPDRSMSKQLSTISENILRKRVRPPVNWDDNPTTANQNEKQMNSLTRRLNTFSENYAQTINPTNDGGNLTVRYVKEDFASSIPKHSNITSENAVRKRTLSTRLREAKSHPFHFIDAADHAHAMLKRFNPKLKTWTTRIENPTRQRKRRASTKEAETLLLTHTMPKHHNSWARIESRTKHRRGRADVSKAGSRIHSIPKHIISKLKARTRTENRTSHLKNREPVNETGNLIISMAKQLNSKLKTWTRTENRTRRRNSRAAVDEAEDLAYLMQGESASNREKMEEMIASDFSTPEDLDKGKMDDPFGKIKKNFEMFRSKWANMMSQLKSQVGDEFKMKVDLESGKGNVTKTASKKKLNKPLHGLAFIEAAWGPWGSWSDCTAQCHKEGFSLRRRSCDTLPDIPCEGNSIDVSSCKEGIKCEAAWQPWSDWGPCSVTCGDGVLARTRMCTTQDVLKTCKGKGSDFHNCKMQPCNRIDNNNATAALNPKGGRLIAAPVGGTGALVATTAIRGGRGKGGHYQFTMWSRWGSCSNSCGKGTRRRGRHCLDARNTPPILVQVRHCGGGLTMQIRHCTGHCKMAPAAKIGAAGGVGAGAAAVAYSAEGADHQPVADYEVINEETSIADEGGGAVVEEDDDDDDDDDESLLTPETFIFIALVLLAMLLFIVAFCICIVQKIQSARMKSEIRSLQPFYKPHGDLPPGGKAQFREIYNYDEFMESKHFAETAKVSTDSLQFFNLVEGIDKEQSNPVGGSYVKEDFQSQRLTKDVEFEKNHSVFESITIDAGPEAPNINHAKNETQILEVEEEIPNEVQDPPVISPPPETVDPSDDVTVIVSENDLPLEVEDSSYPPTPTSTEPPTPVLPLSPAASPPSTPSDETKFSETFQPVSKSASVASRIRHALRKSHMPILTMGNMSEEQLATELYNKMGLQGNIDNLLRALNAQRIRSATNARKSKRAKVKQLGRRGVNLRQLGQVVRKKDAENKDKANATTSTGDHPSGLKRRPSNKARAKATLACQERSIYRMSGKGFHLSSSSYRAPQHRPRRKPTGLRSSPVSLEKVPSSEKWLLSLLSETDKNLDDIDSEVDRSFKTLLYGKRKNSLCADSSFLRWGVNVKENNVGDIGWDDVDDTIMEDKESDIFGKHICTVETESEAKLDECSRGLLVCRDAMDKESLGDVSGKRVRHKRPIGKKKKKITHTDSSVGMICSSSQPLDSISTFVDEDYDQKKKAVLNVMEEVSKQHPTYDSKGLREVLSKIEMSRHVYAAPNTLEGDQIPESCVKEETYSLDKEGLGEDRKPSPFAEIWMDELGKIMDVNDKNTVCVKSDAKNEIISYSNNGRESFAGNEEGRKDETLRIAVNFPELDEFPTSYDDKDLPVIFDNTISIPLQLAEKCPGEVKSNEFKHLLTDQIDAFANSSSKQQLRYIYTIVDPAEQLSDQPLLQTAKTDYKSFASTIDAQPCLKSSTTKLRLSKSFLKSACDDMKKGICGNALLSKSNLPAYEETPNIENESTDFESVNTRTSSVESDSFWSICTGDPPKTSFHVKLTDSESDKASLYTTPPRTITREDCSTEKSFPFRSAYQMSPLTKTSTPSGIVKDNLVLDDYGIASIHNVRMSEDQNSSDALLSCYSGTWNRPQLGDPTRYALPFENSLYSIQSFGTFESSHFTNDGRGHGCDKELPGISQPRRFQKVQEIKTREHRSRDRSVKSREKIIPNTDDDFGCRRYYPTNPNSSRETDQSKGAPRQHSTFQTKCARLGLQTKMGRTVSERAFVDGGISSGSASSGNLDETSLLPMASLSISITNRDREYAVVEGEQLATVQSSTKAFSYYDAETSRISQNSNWTCFPESNAANDYLTPLPPVSASTSTVAFRSAATPGANATAREMTTSKKATKQLKAVSVAFVPAQSQQESGDDEVDAVEWQHSDASWSPFSLHSSTSSKGSTSATDPSLSPKISDSSIEIRNDMIGYREKNWSI